VLQPLQHDWFWVLVKFAGLALLTYAAFALVMVVTLLGDLPFSSVLLRLVINVGALAAAGIWLIRDGNLLMTWALASDRTGVEEKRR
jgi:hypothetical protein